MTKNLTWSDLNTPAPEPEPTTNTADEGNLHGNGKMTMNGKQQGTSLDHTDPDKQKPQVNNRRTKKQTVILTPKGRG